MDEFRISTDPMPKKRLTKPFVGKRSILFDIYGAGGVTRTRDLRITNALLYQLSYTSIKYTEKLLQIIPNCAKIISENIGITLYIILDFLILSREAVKNES